LLRGSDALNIGAVRDVNQNFSYRTSEFIEPSEFRTKSKN
jgi:hypothetical protein